MLKVYLAGSSAEHVRIQRIAGSLLSSGLVTLPNPWWESAALWAGRDAERSLEEQRSIVNESLSALGKCHVFWLVAPALPTRGAWFELGLAVRMKPALRVIVTGPGSSDSVYTSVADFRDESTSLGFVEVMREACIRKRQMGAAQ